ncbi:MAG TPA: hypothetical protein VM865_06415 [Acidobacteriaceae bacterium]|jgi:hypothetical protein|nr:hypothetical protein [Acidobacteriaceae bacterium]
MLVIPWADPETGTHFVNLRTEPYDLAEIPEAEQHPPLGRALRALNAVRSPFMTAKCDAWPVSGREGLADLEPLRIELVLPEEECSAAFTSYIDLLWRERGVFASAHHQQDRLDRLSRRAGKLQHPEAALQCVLRPAMLDIDSPLEGFATTLYVTGVAANVDLARQRWASALEDVVDLLRSREFEIARGSATIDL